ncbi:hypothetical protein WJX81_005930 [Elliptochloris bilobata]|uniref:Protein ENHANCED DISEASE RESISTANCE 2 C-terminal domain-containing protein n=1 Tax=Elliptochloris bilobata TaxID=381761 RepID=A0AAW1RUU7_9CHLO
MEQAPGLGQPAGSSELAQPNGASASQLRSHRSGQRLGHSPAASYISEIDYLDARSELGADEGGSPPGVSLAGSSPTAQRAAGDFARFVADERRRSAQGASCSHMPRASVLDRASLLFRRDSSRGRRQAGLEGPGKQVHAVEAPLEELDGEGAAQEAAPPDAVLEPEQTEAGLAKCLPSLPLFTTAGSGHRRFIRTLKPPAGSSFKRQQGHVGRADGIECWEEADACTFSVRGREYMQTRTKVPSAPAIYRLLGCDVYSFEFKINHIARHIRLPEPPELGAAALALPPERRLPPLLVINIQLPMYPTSLFGGACDGFGHSLVYYFGLPDGWEPLQVGNDAALGLLERFVHNAIEADGTPTRDRFKLVPRVANPEQWAADAPLSAAEYRLLQKYNDKPLLTRPQHKFFLAPDMSYMELDLDVHGYAYLARKAFQAFLPRLSTVIFENGFVIQGNREDELPEVILACARVSRIDFALVRPFPARLERTASSATRVLPQEGSPRLGADGLGSVRGSAREKPVMATT